MTEPTLPTAVELHLVINGEAVTATVPPRLSLMRYLRDTLHLLGTKDGCGSGHCGACTVILNGKAVRACLQHMEKLEGAKIQTVEGLAQGTSLHAIQAAFIEKNAIQCGFCIPGMLMTGKALLDANPKPTTDEITRALAENRNTCRCTGYRPIIEAIQLAGEWMAAGREYVPLPAGGEEIDRSMRREEALRVVRGSQVYGDDIHEPGMLHGKVLLSALPHAEILQVDTTAAEDMPGVVCIITAGDIPGKNQAGLARRDQPAIAAERVRYIGDCLAAVFAETPQQAAAAVDAIQVVYRPLEGVFSPAQAAEPGAPQLHPGGNLMHHAAIRRGDVHAAFGQCAVVIEQTYTTPFIEHAFLEPESGVAYPDGGGGVVIECGTQTAFDMRTQLAEILNLPAEKVRIRQLPMGGAFGGKEDLTIQQFLALGALKSGRKVRMTLSRAESLRMHPKRHAAQMRFKTGCDAAGHVLALEAEITLDTGAYASVGETVLQNTVVFAAGPYYIPNLAIDGKAWYTNNIPAGAMRGFGVNQVAFAMEQQMDAMARALGMDAFAFRMINALDVGMPTATGQILQAGVVSIKETIRAAEEAFERLELPPVGEGRRRGVGVACAVKNIGFGQGACESAGAELELDADGVLTVRHSQHEYGQGATTAVLRLVESELGIAAGMVRVVGPDTALTPETGSTTASRQTFLTGNAVVLACRALKDEVTSRAAEALDCPPERLRIRGGTVEDIESGVNIRLAQLAPRFVVARRYTSPPSLHMSPPGSPPPTGVEITTHWGYAYNTQVAVVEVDELSGVVQVLKIISAHDLGRVLNREAVIGQIEGGVMMGVGYALSEQFVMQNGINQTDTLHKCRLPSAKDAPQIIPVILEIPHPHGPLGLKGFAEAPSLATAPAILNAIYDAVGVRMYDLPADARRVRAALQKAKA